MFLYWINSMTLQCKRTPGENKGLWTHISQGFVHTWTAWVTSTCPLSDVNTNPSGRTSECSGLFVLFISGTGGEGHFSVLYFKHTLMTFAAPSPSPFSLKCIKAAHSVRKHAADHTHIFKFQHVFALFFFSFFFT